MAAKRQRGWSFIQVPEGDDGKGSLWAGELRAVCAEADSRWLYRGRASATVFDGLCRDYHVSFVLSLADGSAAVRATFERVLSATAAFSLVAGELFITNVQRLGASVYNVGLAIEPCEQFFALRQTLADAAGGSVGYGRAGHVSLLYVHVSHLDAATAFVDKHRRRFAGRQLLVDRVHLQLGGSALPVQLRVEIQQ